jgi:type II secretory pathway component GspD/PulD (secretin)
MVLSSGCNNFSSDKKDPFLDLYSRISADDDINSDSVNGKSNLFTFSCSEMPLPVFVRWFSDVTGQGVVYGANADRYLVTAEFKLASPGEVMNAISRRFNLEIVRVGNTFYLGVLKAEDRGYLVRRVRCYAKDDIVSIVTTFLSEFGKVSVQTDGLTVVSDRESILVSISNVLDSMEKKVGNTWILQFYLLGVRKDLSLDGGANVASSGQIAYSISKGSGGNFDFQDIGQNFDLVLNAKSDYISLVASPMFLLRDGQSGLWQDGQTIPIPEKTVSAEGTVTTSGFSFVDTGLILKASVRETYRGASLDVDLTDSTIKGYIEYQPILSKSVLHTNLEIVSGRVFLIGELNRKKEIKGFKNLLNFSSSDEFTNFQLFCRVYKIGKPKDFNFQ